MCGVSMTSARSIKQWRRLRRGVRREYIAWRLRTAGGSGSGWPWPYGSARPAWSSRTLLRRNVSLQTPLTLCVNRGWLATRRTVLATGWPHLRWRPVIVYGAAAACAYGSDMCGSNEVRGHLWSAIGSLCNVNGYYDTFSMANVFIIENEKQLINVAIQLSES